jgi:hypothetical protein
MSTGYRIIAMLVMSAAVGIACEALLWRLPVAFRAPCRMRQTFAHVANVWALRGPLHW